jgi:hypothetical protein
VKWLYSMLPAGHVAAPPARPGGHFWSCVSIPMMVAPSERSSRTGEGARKEIEYQSDVPERGRLRHWSCAAKGGCLSSTPRS